MFTEKKTIELCDCDYTGKLKPEVLFIRFGEIATNDAYHTHIYSHEMIGHYGWIVSKQTLKMKMPLYLDDVITLTTEPRKGSHVIFPRIYKIEKEGEIVATCSSTWTMFDLDQRKVIRPKELGIDLSGLSQNELEAPVTLFSRDDKKKVASRIVSYSDVDVNGHMNNTRYVRLAYDLLPFDYHKDHVLKELSINYKRELAPLAQVDLYLSREEDLFFVEGICEDECCFLMSLQFMTI